MEQQATLIVLRRPLCAHGEAGALEGEEGKGRREGVSRGVEGICCGGFAPRVRLLVLAGLEIFTY